jgi:hypothetical protein
VFVALATAVLKEVLRAMTKKVQPVTVAVSVVLGHGYASP